MSYIDGFVIPVPAGKKAAYREMCASAAAIFKEYGAERIVECWGDDVPEGKVTSFPMAVKRKDDEVVVFSWVTWPSKAARNEGMKRFMEDPRMKDGMKHMPFDGQRMIYGGFQAILEKK